MRCSEEYDCLSKKERERDLRKQFFLGSVPHPCVVAASARRDHQVASFRFQLSNGRWLHWGPGGPYIPASFQWVYVLGSAFFWGKWLSSWEKLGMRKTFFSKIQQATSTSTCGPTSSISSVPTRRGNQTAYSFFFVALLCLMELLKMYLFMA